MYALKHEIDFCVVEKMRRFSLPTVMQNYEEIARSLRSKPNFRLVKALAGALAVRSGTLLLDAGCGCGGDARQLWGMTGARVVCLDLSLPMLAQVHPEQPRLRADVRAMPFPESCFDGLYAVNLLQLLPERREFLMEAARVLRPGGRIGLPVTTREQLGKRFLNRFFPGLEAVERARYPACDMLIQELLSAGFEAIQALPLDLGTFRMDEAYVRRQRTGITSGLLLLSDAERRLGLKALDEAVATSAASGDYPEIPWRRTLLVARKAFA